ncbi:uncharacterized protein LOC106475708 isoform X2 [Limulus polyphemus]|uniref:Uncharacterized protein LOC106475708 isoform X2 n=1 Tax=Limulus polyphemus TaxID=6850 RepID=A0ABM1RVS3_LIMPO|nr:uncharacterized protein LOC106475708 isoform X2 [Limulus polyphemus]
MPFQKTNKLRLSQTSGSRHVCQSRSGRLGSSQTNILSHQNCSQDYDKVKKLMNTNEADSHLTGLMETLRQAEQKLLSSRIWLADPKFEIWKRLYWKNVQNSLSHWNQNQKRPNDVKEKHSKYSQI